MAWTSISNAAVAVGAIPSSSTVTALRDNPVAIADASSGAPVVFAGWHPVDKVSVGDGKDGVIYDFAVNGVLAEVVTPDFEDGYEYRIIGVGISHNSGITRSLRLQLFKETSAVYDNTFDGQSGVSSSIWTFDWEILLPRISSTSHFSRLVIQKDAVFDATSIASNYNATMQKILRARVVFSANSLDAGKIFLFRRREYASSP